MPELPEVETVRQTLKNFIIGKQIKEIEIPYDQIIVGDAETFASELQGQTIHQAPGCRSAPDAEALLFALVYYSIYQAILQSFLAGHEIIALCVPAYFFN